MGPPSASKRASAGGAARPRAAPRDASEEGDVRELRGLGHHLAAIRLLRGLVLLVDRLRLHVLPRLVLRHLLLLEFLLRLDFGAVGLRSLRLPLRRLLHRLEALAAPGDDHVVAWGLLRRQRLGGLRLRRRRLATRRGRLPPPTVRCR